jgi:hypothetical protein
MTIRTKEVSTLEYKVALATIAILEEAGKFPEGDPIDSGALPRALTRADMWTQLCFDKDLKALGLVDDEKHLKLFDRVRSRLRKGRHVTYDGSNGWLAKGVYAERRRILALRQNHVDWREALRSLAREAGGYLMSASDDTWEDVARRLRARYRAVENMGAEVFAQRGMPCDLEILVHNLEA